MKRFDIVIVGDSYHRNQQSLFLQDLENFKAELAIRLPYRAGQFNFIPLTHDNNFRCTPSTTWEGSTCDYQKVTKLVASYGYKQGTQMMVLSEKIPGGGGGQIPIGGTAFHDREHSGEICLHELCHPVFFGDGHTGGFMNSSGSWGASGWNTTFTQAQMNIINARLNILAEPFPTPQPTIEIVGTQILLGGGNTLIVSSKVTGCVQWIETWVDGVLKATQMYWGDHVRNQYCNPVDGIIKIFLNPTAIGQHTVTLRAYDINHTDITPKFATVNQVITV